MAMGPLLVVEHIAQFRDLEHQSLHLRPVFDLHLLDELPRI
jgi:hypothetical protein